MATSQARIDANRRNALKSTGPKTAEGKAKSRANALKHGLTGEGIALFPDDQARVEELEAKLVADAPPGNEMVAALFHRFAVLSVRLDRCTEHDAAMTAHRVRHAVADHDNQRHAEVDEQAGRLAADPFDAVRRLKQGPEGIDWLLRRWKALRDEVAAPTAGPADLIDRAGALLGLTAAEARVSEWAGPCLALAGESSGEAGGADARAWILAQVDGEVELLRWLRAEIDEESEEADRAEAPKRALFDFSPHAERLRRYEAAAERHLFRTLKELRQEQEIVVAVKNAPRPALVPPPVPSRFQKPAPVPASAPIPPPPPCTPAQARILTPAERSILNDLPAPARALALEYSNFIDISAIPAAVAEVRNQREAREAKARRPKLR